MSSNRTASTAAPRVRRPMRPAVLAHWYRVYIGFPIDIAAKLIVLGVVLSFPVRATTHHGDHDVDLKRHADLYAQAMRLDTKSSGSTLADVGSDRISRLSRPPRSQRTWLLNWGSDRQRDRARRRSRYLGGPLGKPAIGRRRHNLASCLCLAFPLGPGQQSAAVAPLPWGRWAKWQHWIDAQDPGSGNRLLPASCLACIAERFFAGR
jgi:hypothetical protein